MSEKIESTNKALVLQALDTLFNKRDYAAAERFWSPDYVQHSAHIALGREGLFSLVNSLPTTLKWSLTRMGFRFHQTNQLLANPMEDLSR
jgi:hypothetical protein